MRKRAHTQFITDSLVHETQLEALWDFLTLERERSGGRYTDEWDLLGFQGKDPKTDFRAAGMLALDNMLTFCQNNPDEARALLLLSTGSNMKHVSPFLSSHLISIVSSSHPDLFLPSTFLFLLFSALLFPLSSVCLLLLCDCGNQPHSLAPCPGA